MSDINKTHDSSMLARIWTRDLSSISGGSENLFNQYENQYDGSSGSCSTSNEVNSKGDSSYHRDTCRTTSIVAISTTTRNWGKPRSLSTEE